MVWAWPAAALAAALVGEGLEAFEAQAEALGFTITGGEVTVVPSGNVHGKCTVEVRST